MDLAAKRPSNVIGNPDAAGIFARSAPDVIDEVALVLANALGDDTLARVLNDLVGAGANPRLPDIDVGIAGRIFDTISVLRPDAVIVAQNL